MGSIVGTTTSTAAGTCQGCKVLTTVTTYSSGAQLIVTQYVNNKGKITKTTSQYVPGGSGGSGSAGSGSGGGVSQALSTPNTVTGYQQTRNIGKLGRVTWHELFRQ